ATTNAASSEVGRRRRGPVISAAAWGSTPSLPCQWSLFQRGAKFWPEAPSKQFVLVYVWGSGSPEGALRPRAAAGAGPFRPPPHPVKSGARLRRRKIMSGRKIWCALMALGLGIAAASASSDALAQAKGKAT